MNCGGAVSSCNILGCVNLPKKNIMIFSPARSGSTLISLIFGAHSKITNYGESHWASKESMSRNENTNESDWECRAHGVDCSVVSEISKSLRYENHLEVLSNHSDTEYILTSNKNQSHYLKMDYKETENYILLIYKPPEVWAGSYLDGKKMKIPDDPGEASLFLCEKFYQYYDRHLEILDKNEHMKNYFVVDYLRLVDEGEKYVREICDFLGIEFESQMMEFNTYLTSGDSNQHPIGGNRKTYVTLNKGKDDRYNKDENNIYFEKKYLGFLNKSHLETIRSDPRYSELVKKLKIKTSARILIEGEKDKLLSESVIFIATDRLYAGRMAAYGGYLKLPNIEKMVKNGRIYKNAISTAGSTLMCHSTEWSGRYPSELHGEVPYNERVYHTPMEKLDTVFTDFLERGFDAHIVLVKKRPGKTYDSFSPIFNLWPDELNIVTIPDWDRPGGELLRRKDQILMAEKLVNESVNSGRPAFVFVKCHGYHRPEFRAKYIDYADQTMITYDDLYNAEIDDAMGLMLDSYNYPDGACPDIWFASDHGSWAGENYRNHYGYHLHQEIVHVPLISSKGGGEVIDNVFSMKEVRRLLTGNSPNLEEEYIYAETLYPGQINLNPDSGIFSMAKIMVRKGKYKYIYSMHGIEGDSEPCEELFDLDYDPLEKFNMAQAFERGYKDVARVTKNGIPFNKITQRVHSDAKMARKFDKFIPDDIDGLSFKKEFQFSGWPEIHEILIELRGKAKDYWENTGRGEHFKF